MLYKNEDLVIQIKPLLDAYRDAIQDNNGARTAMARQLIDNLILEVADSLEGAWEQAMGEDL